MKPTNTKIPPCNPISSNCVIWEGPDIPCINLCKGDTISDVTAKLAEQLCIILDYLNVSNYNLTCFNLTTCSPENFQQLLQLIIDRICELEGVTPTTTSARIAGGCPNCVVNIAPCFVYTNPQNGDPVTQLQLTDYVSLIGLQICTILADIVALQNGGGNINNRLTTLENNKVSQYITPQITPVCVLPSIPTDINIVLAELEKQFCVLLGAVGSSTDIYVALAAACAGLNTDGKLAGSGNMSTIPGWIVTPKNMADSMKNMWLTICDLRSAVKNIKQNCCPSGCDGIKIDFTVIKFSPTSIKLFFTGTIPAEFVECNPVGTLFTITDDNGGFINTTIVVKNNMNNIVGYTIDLSSTPVNPNNNLNIFASLCLRSNLDGTTCQSVLEYELINQSICPTVLFVPTVDTIAFSFPHTGGSATYNIELWDSSLSNLLQVQSIPVNTPQSVTGTFATLTPGTTYQIRLKVISGENTTVCPYSTQATLPDPCPAPTNIVSQLDIP